MRTFRDAAITFQRSPLLSALSVTTIAFSLFAFGLFGLVALNIREALNKLEDRVEKLAGPAGTKVTFGPLLFADDAGKVEVGRPTVSGVTVEAEIIEQGLGKKIIIFKYKRRKSYRRKAGHRQPFTSLKITSIRAA